MVGLGQSYVTCGTTAVTVVAGGKLLTGVVTLHGQSVIVRVVGLVTVYVLLLYVKVVGDGQTVVKAVTTWVT